MPIVIDRKTGKILAKPEYTQEQKDHAWEVLMCGWAAMNRDILQQLQERAGESKQGSSD